MKVILLSSATCLVLCFCLGRMGESGMEEVSEIPTVDSRRRISVRGASTSERERESARDGEKLVRLISEYDALRGEGITEARMMAWILQLESSEIPGALDFLMERERSEYGDELDGNDREIGGEMLALLARWYELDGEGVITWVRGQKEWTKEDTLKAEILMICDGYHRDPRRGFELCLDWIEQGRQGDGPGSTGRLPGEAYFRDVILYQVGRWGSDPKAMLEQVNFDGELRATFYVSMSGGGLRGSSRLNAGGMGFPYTPSKSSDYSSNPAMRAFARGLADSGRSSLLREMVGAWREEPGRLLRLSLPIHWKARGGRR